MNTSGIAKELGRVPWYGWGAIGAIVLAVMGKNATAATPQPPAIDPGAPKGGPQPLIKSGSIGEVVKLWQGILGSVPSTGVFDAATVAATKAWQTVHGLKADGVVGPMSWYTAGYYDPDKPPVFQTPSGPQVPPEVIGAGGSGSDYNPYDLPEDISEREAKILQIIGAGQYDNVWEPITISEGGHTITAYISKRAVALDNGSERYTFNMSYSNAWKVAKLLNAVFITTKLSDALAKDSTAKKLVVGKVTRPWSQDSTMAKTFRMNEQAVLLNDLVGDWNGPVVNEGKDWVISKRDWEPNGSNRSTNFGWYPGGSKSPGGASVIQSVGKTHDKNHTDYSQLVRVLRREVILDGSPVDVATVLTDPNLAYLLSDEGVLPDVTPPGLMGVA